MFTIEEIEIFKKELNDLLDDYVNIYRNQINPDPEIVITVTQIIKKYYSRKLLSNKLYNNYSDDSDLILSDIESYGSPTRLNCDFLSGDECSDNENFQYFDRIHHDMDFIDKENYFMEAHQNIDCLVDESINNYLDNNFNKNMIAHIPDPELEILDFSGEIYMELH